MNCKLLMTGIALLCCIGEFAWAQLEPEEGRYDFAWMDKALALADKYKLKVVLCTSTATPPVWLTRAHPEISLFRIKVRKYGHSTRTITMPAALPYYIAS